MNNEFLNISAILFIRSYASLATALDFVPTIIIFSAKQQKDSIQSIQKKFNNCKHTFGPLCIFFLAIFKGRLYCYKFHCEIHFLTLLLRNYNGNSCVIFFYCLFAFLHYQAVNINCKVFGVTRLGVQP